MRTDGSQVRELAVDLDRSVGETTINDATAPGVNGRRIAWFADSRSLLVGAADRGQGRLFSVDVASGKYTELSHLKQGEVRDFSLSRNGISRRGVQFIGAADRDLPVRRVRDRQAVETSLIA